ncbi:MAG: hypothetical protein OXF08_06930, partial [Bacteroidetes bacterium]|nr:hypothetical protein [Bacteroidota bacterium]
MEWISYTFLTVEIYAFWRLIKFQLNHEESARNALDEIHLILKRPTFNQNPVSQILFDQLERHTELPLDKIRSYANAALVTGIGGTMALFVIEAFPIGIYIISSSGSGIQLPPWHTIFIGLILALLSSFIGVYVHLLITSKIFSEAHEAVIKRETELVCKSRFHTHSSQSAKMC